MRGPDRPPSRWRVHGISSTGYRHIRDNTPCQDAWDRLETPGGLVLAVADGAGSAPRSGEGAREAVRLAVEAFAPVAAPWRRIGGARLCRERMTEAFHEVRARYLRWCEGPPGPYATTLTVVVAADGWLGQASVGDGLVLVRAAPVDAPGGGDTGAGSAGSGMTGASMTGSGMAGPGFAGTGTAGTGTAGTGGATERGSTERGVREGAASPSYHLLPRAHTGSEYANETVFLGSPTALGQLRVDCVRDDGIDGVLLSTDGLTQALLRRAPAGPPLPHDAFLGHLFDRLGRSDYDHDEEDRRLSDFLASDQITRVTGDDKTLLWAIRHDDH
ncbi:PP2C family serine/threonine-protein phosphatase [Streptomyces sp. NPDC006339]|uniref:PP2C family serine/threonine-protein phosphatase n=1 Tax=Streptomyces sp. NPDC006339 TaxID=3156755 RepID=UPI0033B82C63